MRSKYFGVLQRVGKSLMLPVAVLPVAGMLLGIGSASFSIIPDIVSGVMASAGGAIFGNLAVIFAIGTSIGLTEGKGEAALAALVGYVVMLGSMGVMALQLGIEPVSVMGIPAMDTGVFGGIIVGILAAGLFKKYSEIQLPEYLGFFSGKRFVPIVTGFSALFLGVLLSFIWPSIQWAIDLFSQWAVQENSIMAGFIYGVGERILVPFGLHHIWNVPFHMQMGEFKDAAGVIYNGDIPRFFAGDSTAGFLAGGYLFKMFGLPAAALAIWHCAKSENKSAVGGIMLSAIFTCIITGITEPIEFVFIFVAPVLYGIHAILSGLAFAITNAFGIKMAMSFSNGLIDYLLYFSLATKPLWILLIGSVYMVVYYVIFRASILLLNLSTPGRESDVGPSSTWGTDKKDSADEKQLIDRLMKAFGGRDNIINLDACITRLRVTIRDINLVDKKEIKILGASAIVVVGDNIQAIFGTRSERICTQMERIQKG